MISLAVLGEFGPVYKGTLYNGQEVVVKRLSINSAQGDIEFKTEITLVSKLQHRNLVKPLGFCLEKGERLLVSEFLPNRSLDYEFFGALILEIVSGKKNNSIFDGRKCTKSVRLCKSFPHWVIMCSRKCSSQANHGFRCCNAR
ncbi:hypothetical protein K1719_001461 [Acacia pycnantha]|nr:hypothetical protein K1719_001461 [Acacia pycnantha]